MASIFTFHMMNGTLVVWSAILLVRVDELTKQESPKLISSVYKGLQFSDKALHIVVDGCRMDGKVNATVGTLLLNGLSNIADVKVMDLVRFIRDSTWKVDKT